jgi:isoquinoline 1-oxidoreductase beta subunit
MSAATQLDRRGFLKTSAAAAGGLLVAFQLPETSGAAVTSASLNAFVHVGSDDLVTLIIHKGEMGQGTVTSLSMLLAEELECDWQKIRTGFAPIDPAYGGFQGVVGSGSIRSSFGPLRQAGAAAREMLVQAAAG